MTEHLRNTDATTHEFYNGTVVVNEFNFTGSSVINDAYITLTGRYPDSGYAVNDVSTALISIESGEGEITIKNLTPTPLNSGDRVIIKPGEPYFFSPLGHLALRYIATPAWTPDQARIVD